MTERDVRPPAQERGHRRPRRRLLRRTESFYRSVLHEAEVDAFAEAGGGGLEDEVALLRVLVRRHIEEHPEHLDLTIKGLSLLVRMVAVQFRLSGADEEQLRGRLSDILNQFTAAVYSEEAADG